MVTETRPEKVAGAAEHPAGGGAQPGVSVIIPAYNAAGTLRRAVNSVFSQHHPVLELIIVDDASSDDTPDLIRTMDHPKLRYIRLARNGGVSNARNQGIEAAKGELIAFLDADDEWLPNKISLQMNEFLSRKNISLVSCDSYDIAPSGEVMGLHSSERAPAAGARAWVTLLKYAFITTSTALIPKQYLSITGGFDSNLRVAEDQDLWIRLARLGEVAFVNEPLVLKHFVPASLSIGGPAHDLLTYLLPMLMRHIAAARADLSKEEIGLVLSSRFGRIGRQLYTSGLPWQGLKLIVKAILQGDGFWMNFRFTAINSPIGVQLRKLLKG